ncbi:sulfite exporter TauE/SafE family protein [Kocuria soli]|uniref:Probable membrane transporter protein n=1 Tax=Kocuria soli TaxID=2485125 RepID=A0A3N3ZSK5_9MICC|nr:sulfite exporter TauE/SafE family protein [Kocuria soli]ROZ64595.1 sulfite exporter TauE/SafE family protein [Kocuria soli]
MSWLLILTLVLALLIGLSLGTLGGGGSILTVPMLTYVAGLDPREAIATSLFVVGVTSAISALTHARRGFVEWRTGLIFGVTSMAAAFLGAMLGEHISPTALMVAFAVMMVVTSAAMIRGRRPCEGPNCQPEYSRLKLVLIGLGVGLVTGLIGAGGGFLVVPALALLAGLSMPAAVGTSLLVIAMNSFAGLAGHLSSVQVQWSLVAAVTTTAVLGSLVGSRVAAKVPAQVLRKGFGWFVLVVGIVVLVQELPDPAGLVLAGIAAVTGVAALVCRLVPACPLGSRPAPS